MVFTDPPYGINIVNSQGKVGAPRLAKNRTYKPVRMLSEVLRDFSNDGDNILDCFGGSGSTLMACEQTKRHCFMMEYDEHYCDVIIARWEKFTGRKAAKIN